MISGNPSIIGETLRQRYKIIKKLSEGGIGETYRAEDLDGPADPKPPRCVVKRLRPERNYYPKIVELFRREGETLKKLGRHDQIPTLYDYFEDEENQRFYLVQELIEGHDLSKEIIQGQRWSEAEVIKFLQEILEVLAFVHQNGVIHRDIKPANIMRRQGDGKLVLIDFGAVKEVSASVINEKGEVSSTIVVGTLGYMPNEQMHGRPRFSSDIYAVGMTAILALTGVDPRDLGDGDGNVNWLSRAQVSDELANILTKMVQFKAADRYTNATEVLQALRNIEPISGFLGWVLLKATLGFISDPTNADLNQCKAGVEEFINALKQAKPSVNHELQKAVFRSLLKAQKHIAQEYQNQLAGSFPNFIQHSPFHSQQHRDDLRWVKQRLAQFDREIKAVNQVAPMELTAELLAQLKLPEPNEIRQRKEQLLAAVLKEQEPDRYVEMLRRDSDGLLTQLCACFAEEINRNQQLRDILYSMLLAPMRAQLKIKDLESSLVSTKLDLEKYKLQYPGCQTTVTFRSRPPIKIKLENPEGPMDPDSLFYVDRPPIESECYETIANPGALIRVKAPRQMGKSSLMSRILDRARQQGYQPVLLDFKLENKDNLSSLDRLLQSFCSNVSQKLGIEDKVADYWQNSILGSKNKCTNYFQRQLLSNITIPLVLGLDNVDKIFQHQEVAIDFFVLLRAWHEQSKSEEVWKKLRLVIVHSQEVDIPLETNHSPFNVGLPIKLRELNQTEVADLVGRHGLNWSSKQREELIAMVGGHPYLVRKALYEIAKGNMTLEKLLQVAPTEQGPYTDHLRPHKNNLKKNANLAAAMKRVLAANGPVEIPAAEAFKLRSMGLVKFQGEKAVMPLCDLYRLYLGSCLQ